MAHARIRPRTVVQRLLGRGRILLAILAAVLGVVAPSPAQSSSAHTFDLTQSDIKPDPAVRYGVLANGLHYALMPNTLPPGAVSIRFSVRAGSLSEAGDERGLFHFIEHMAFNGSRSVREGDMVKRLERLGLAFGPDANAATGFSFTTYALDLPRSDYEAINDCLFLLREIASELSFDPAAIERERGVVLAEIGRSATFESRRRDQLLDFLAPGLYAASRKPAGQEEVILAAKPDALRRLYDRFYRPERASLIIVGDFEPDAMEERIAVYFSDWEGRGEPGVDANEAYSLPTRPSEASVLTHPSGGDTLSVYSLSRFREFPETIAGREESVLLALGLGAINRRLAAAANAQGAAYRSAQLFASDILESASYAGGSVSVVPGQWKEGLEALEQAWRRALLYGFTQAEIDQQKAVLKTALVRAAQQEATRPTTALADRLMSSIQNDEVFASPLFNLGMFETLAQRATPEAVLEAFRAWMKRDTPLFFMSSSIALPGAEQKIPQAWRLSEDTKVEGPKAETLPVFSYREFGAPGRVVLDRRLDRPQARAIVFDNNVRLNLMQTSIQREAVLVSLRIGEGAIALEDGPIGLASLMNAYAAGGLENHSYDDLRAMLGDRSVQAGIAVFPEHFGGVYSTTASDLELQLQLAAAYVLHPGYRAEAERKWRESIVLSWPRLDADARSVFASQGSRLLADGDRRFGADPSDGVTDRSFSELKAYLKPLLQNAPIEIAIVGDFNEDDAIVAVAATFGAFPPRPSPTPRPVSRHPVTFARGDGPILLRHQGEPTQGLLKIYWPVAIDPDEAPQQARELSLLGSIVQLKLLEVAREELGAAYAPSAGFSSSGVYPGLNYLFVELEARPADLPRLDAVVRAIAADLRNGLISEDELKRAKAPSLDQLAQHASSNGYWLSVIAQLQTRPDRSERFMLDAVDASIRAISLEDVVSTAELWLQDPNLRSVTVLPAQAAADLAKGQPAP
jgi:zinc protease